MLKEVSFRFRATGNKEWRTSGFREFLPGDSERFLTRNLSFHLAIPVFLDLSSKPVDVNATEGSDVVFNCKAHAKPKAIVEWMRNGEILDRKLIFVILQYDRYLCRV